MTKFTEVFTPHAPPKSKEYLVGRARELEDFIEFVEQPGAVPVILGPRGIGKTSLVYIGAKSFRHARVNCGDSSTLDSLARRILEELGLDIYTKETIKELGVEVEAEAEFSPFWRFVKIGGKAKGSGKTSKTVIELGAREITRDLFYQILTKFKSDFLVILDEFDTLHGKSDLVSDLSTLIKDLADHAYEHHCHVAVSGIGRSATDILKGHRSSKRQIEEVFLNPLSEEDIHGFLLTASKNVGFTFADDIATRIAEDSMGFPYYAHLLGAACYMEASRRGSGEVIVDSDVYASAKQRAVRRAFRSYLRQYGTVVSRLDEKDVLLLQYLNLPKRRQSLRVSEVKHLLLLNKAMTEKDIDETLDKMFSSREIIIRHPSVRDKIHFVDPLLRPFLNIHLGTPINVPRIADAKHSSRQQELFEL